jgi:WD40 repeat protein/serine/threonine protein kinase/tetratricopeptide (TPR) repeat protein
MGAVPDVKSIFCEALDLCSEAERVAYLDRACGADAELRGRVEALLQAHGASASFLEAPAATGPMAAISPALVSEGPGTLIGPYKLLEPIGEGGMGVVYMAEQTQPVRRKVALKIIKPGMDTRQVVARFEAERQALALMDHANIARVLDAGATASGRPYFVMELVRGIPITEYCDRNRLSIDGRLELFAHVCQAVQHAHQKAIIHRDLKPSNILVTLIDGSAVPKIIDFGVAKAIGHSLTDKTLYTSFAQLIGTPLYMSPEQAEFSGVDVDTRSDIYSLGVLLYELLTGTTPFDQETFRTASYDEVRRIIREQEPPKPSTRISTLKGTQTTVSALRQSDPRRLRKSLHGELDWIVMKCLEKHRNRRYETANSLVADVRRHLNHEPVEASPPSAGYRLRKFARRNRAALLTTAFVATALVAVAVLAVLDADRQRQFGLAKAASTRKITTLAGDLKSSLADANRLLAMRNFDRGQAAFEKGQVGAGLLWMVQSWRSALDAGDPAWQHLARANLAHWRPHYPRLKAVLSHKSAVWGAAFSPDSRTVITGTLDGTAQLWDAASGRKFGPELQVRGQYFGAAFSPDGKTVLTAAESHKPRLWDGTTGEPLDVPLRLPAEFHILSVAIPHEGKFVLVGSAPKADNVARLWDASAGRPIGKPLTHRGHIYPPVFSPDGTIILTPSDDGTARRWEVATGQPVGVPLERQGGFWSAAFSPDGQTIVTGCRDGTALCWDAASGQPIGLPMRHESEVRLVAYSPDGKTILTRCQDKEARIWDAATGQFIGALEHQAGISALAFSPDGKTILTGSLDSTVRLWDANPGQPVGQVLEIPSTDRIADRVSPDGECLVSVPPEPNYQRFIQFWNATTRQLIARVPQASGNVAIKISPHGSVVLTTAADHTARIWNGRSGAPLGAPFPLPSSLEENWSPVRLGPDDKTVLFFGQDQRVSVFDGTTGSVCGRTPPLGGYSFGLEFSPDGKRFFTGLVNGEVRLWDAATVTQVGDPLPNPGGICTGGFSRDGRSLLIACEDGSARLWDLASRKLLISPLRHQSPIYDLEFSPDDKTIATASLDKTVRLWDVATGYPVGPILKHTDGVFFVAFSSDGRFLFTGSGLSRIYSVPPRLPDELERVATWIEVITGLTLDAQQGLIQVLDNAAWLQRRERLMQLGGPPETGPDPRLDPILFGPDPTTRARSLMESKRWAAAEAAFDEAMRARPFNISILAKRGDLYAKRGLWSQAAAYYATVIKNYPDVAPLHECLALARVLAGDLPGYKAACAAMLDRFKPIDDSTAAIRVAYACSLVPEAVPDLPGLLQVAERSTRWVASNERAVGAVHFRAGRFDEALKHFQKVNPTSRPRAWELLFLAMIHGRLRHLDDARQLLAQADQWIANADQSKRGAASDRHSSWSDEYERPTTLLLRREAESVLSGDAELPSEPIGR